MFLALGGNNFTMKSLRLILVGILINLSIINSANADDSMWWETTIGYSGAVVNSGTDVRSIPMYARVRDLSFSVPKSNPDVLIVGLRFDQKFDDKPLEQSKNLLAGIRLANGKVPTCIYNNKCDQVLYFTAPSFWNDKYPVAPSTESVYVYRIPQNQVGDNELPAQNTYCPSLWWIDRNQSSYDSIKFQLSITCLGIEKVMTAYGFAGADIGITPIPFGFTSVATADNPYWQLAKSAYENNGGESSVTKPYISPKKIPTKYLSCKKGTKTKLVKIPGKCPSGYLKQKTVIKMEEVI